ncbi:MAG: polysaccharide biosynthesis tyrosine autokinase [Solirubrobacterales bacterium]|nr:polysaccharide biosynthesis tyrosine autokinase [Solirubrobacterales bacterium]
MALNGPGPGKDELPSAEEGTQARQGADLEVVIRALRDRWLLILACVVLIGGLALVASERAEKEYTAAAKLLFRDPGFDQNLFGATVFPGNTDPEREAATNRQTVDLTETYRRAAEKIPGATAGEIRNSVKAVTDGNSDFVTVEATTPVPERSALMANTVARSFVDWRRENDIERIKAAENQLSDQVAENDGLTETQVQSVQKNIEKLQLLASVQTGNVELAQRASVPTSPSSPNTRLNTAFGLGLGLLLGLCLAFIRARIDRRLRDADDVAAVAGVPVLGEIVKTKSVHPESGIDDPAMRDAFIALRSRLRYFNFDRGVSSIVVTSAAPAEGKSTVSINLVAAAACLGERAVLVEADFRKPVVGRRLGVPPSPGLSELLIGRAARAEVTSTRDVPVLGLGQGENPSIDVITAGSIPPNPQQLMGSAGMSELLAELSGLYDLVVVDTPPALQVTDPMPILSAVDGVVVVCRSGTSTSRQLERLLREVRRLKGNILGVALTAVKKRQSGYGYGYGYGYGESESARKETADA